MLSLALLAGAFSCGDNAGDPHPLDGLRQPSGLALVNGHLLVTNGNWDRAYANASLVAVDLEKLNEGLADVRPAGSSLSGSRPCRMTPGSVRVECRAQDLIDSSATVRIASGAGNIAVDRPAGEDGLSRLLIPSRHQPRVTWIDVTVDEGDLEFVCDQDGDEVCGDAHIIDEVGDDPSRVFVDQEGFRFAYLPHLLERVNCSDDESYRCAGLTLLGLDGQFGPEIVDVESEFFRESPNEDLSLLGGFSIAQRTCDLDSGNVPDNSRDCTRPFLYASQRYWPGVRTFRVAPGLDVILSGGSHAIQGTNVGDALPLPLGADIEFEDPSTGESLLFVHTTPPGLARVDTTLEDGDPKNELVQSVPVCANPNLIEVHRPEEGSWLAFVSCYADDQIVAVDLGSFTVVASIDLGDGSNEMLIDQEREWLFVANTLEDTISVVDLDSTSVTYLREIVTIGLGSERE